MKPFYSISVPKPCHENWNKMTPKDKGRFCASCEKVVIDFSKMSTEEIQDFIHQNKHQKLCGHFKQSQLDSINLSIPIQSLASASIYKMFLFSLLICMGTSIMSCTNNKGQRQKIDSVEVVDSITKNVIDIDTLSKACSTSNSIKKDSATISFPPIVGDIITVEGELDIESTDKIDTTNINAFDNFTIDGDMTIGLVVPETQPEFKNTPKNLSIIDKREYFSKRLSELITKNFNIEIAESLNLKGKHRIYTKFIINKKGQIENIQVRSPHEKIDQEAVRVIKLLPQFIPAKIEDKPVDMSYSLPIIFIIEDE